MAFHSLLRPVLVDLLTRFVTAAIRSAMLKPLGSRWTAGLPIFAIACPTFVWADDNPKLTVKQREAIAVFEKLGATVNYQRKNPGKVGDFALILNANESTKISDRHLAYLGDLTKLESVNLRGTSITDAGLVHLKNLRELSDLDLGFTRITDRGLSHLSGLTSLFYLYFDGTQITDAGVKHLIPLKNLNNMRLSETKVSRKGSARIQEMLPNIKHDVRMLELYVEHGQKIGRIKQRAPWIGLVHFLGGGMVDDADLVQLAQIPKLSVSHPFQRQGNRRQANAIEDSDESAISRT